MNYIFTHLYPVKKRWVISTIDNAKHFNYILLLDVEKNYKSNILANQYSKLTGKQKENTYICIRHFPPLVEEQSNLQWLINVPSFIREFNFRVRHKFNSFIRNRIMYKSSSNFGFELESHINFWKTDSKQSCRFRNSNLTNTKSMTLLFLILQRKLSWIQKLDPHYSSFIALCFAVDQIQLST